MKPEGWAEREAFSFPTLPTERSRSEGAMNKRSSRAGAMLATRCRAALSLLLAALPAVLSNGVYQVGEAVTLYANKVCSSSVPHCP